MFINMDNITHMPAITTIGPPYSYMPMQGNMMGSGTDSGSGMMGWVVVSKPGDDKNEL